MGSENGKPAEMKDLPQTRQEIADFTMTQYVTEYHRVSAQRDDLQNENTQLKAKVSGLEVVAAAQRAQIENVQETTQSQITAMESRVMSMQLERDQAVADRSVYEALFISMQAQMRAFKVPAAPLVRDRAMEDQHEDALDAMQEAIAQPAPMLRSLISAGRRPVVVSQQERGEEGLPRQAPVLGPAER